MYTAVMSLGLLCLVAVNGIIYVQTMNELLAESAAARR
jgi:hypothetical protein